MKLSATAMGLPQLSRVCITTCIATHRRKKIRHNMVGERYPHDSSEPLKNFTPQGHFNHDASRCEDFSDKARLRTKSADIISRVNALQPEVVYT